MLKKRYACSPWFSHVPRKKKAPTAVNFAAGVFHGFPHAFQDSTTCCITSPMFSVADAQPTPTCGFAQIPQNSVPKY
jgi:hypothetical protein